MINFPDLQKDKYALLIVNTYRLPNALNDTLVQIVMLLNWGVPLGNIYILTDSETDPRIKFLSSLIYKKQKLIVKYNNGTNFITRYNEILRTIAIRAQSKADLLISISGHGARIRDRNRDEKDGYDEYILPAGKTVLDESLYSGLLQLGSNFNVLTLTDTCHSGTMFDLDSKNVSTIKAGALSISACGDTQLDWECGCDTTKVKNFLRNSKDISTDDLKKYLSYLPSTYITGSLTSSVIDRAFNGFNDESLKAITKDLKNLGQTVNLHQISKSREIPITTRETTTNLNAVTTTNSGFYWLILVLIIVILVVLVFMVLSYKKNIFMDERASQAHGYQTYASLIPQVD